MVFPVMLMVLGFLPVAGEATHEGKTLKQIPRTDRYGDQLPPGALVRLGSTRFRHPDLVYGLAFSPDSKCLASACDDGSIYCWEASTGKLVRKLTGHERAVKSLAFSPDGKLLASGGDDVTVRLWDPVTGKQLNVLHAYRSRVSSVGFSPDGKFLASMGEADLRVWNPATGKHLHLISRKSSPKITFSPDGKLVSEGTKGQYGLWDPATGKMTSGLGNKDILYNLAIAPDGKTVAGLVEPTRVLLWDPVMGKEIRRIPLTFDDGVRELLFSRDGKRLLCCGLSLLEVMDVGTGKILHTFRGEYNCGMALSPDGKTVAAVNAWTAVQLWNLETGRELRPNSGHEGPVTQIQFSRDGKKVLTTSRDRTTRLWDVATGQELLKIPGEQYLVDSTLSPDDRIIAETSRGLTGTSSIRLWDAATGKMIRRIAGFKESISSLSFSPDGNRVAGIHGFGRILTPLMRVWEVHTGKELYCIEGTLRRPPTSLTFSPDGSLVLSTLGDRMVHFWSLEKGRQVGIVELVKQQATSFTCSRDGKTLAVVGNWEDIHLLEMATGKELRHFKGGDAALSPDSTMIAHNGGLSSTITGERLLELPRHGSISLVRFSPDGKRLATGGSDGTVLIWDLEAFSLKPGLSPKELMANELETLWKTLEGKDAATAYQAIRKLVAAPSQAVPFLEKQLLSDQKKTAECRKVKARRLIRELDSQRYSVREEAVRQLIEMGDTVQPMLQEVLAGNPTLEIRRRAEKVLFVLEASREQEAEAARGLRLSGPTLQAVRAIQVLEYLGNDAAKQLLEKLANGAVTSPQTQEARAAIKRLTIGATR